MTEDERLINETWPLIRETVNKYRPLLEHTGLLGHLEFMSVRRQMDFWLAMKMADEKPMPEIEEIAREVRGRTRGTAPFNNDR